MRCRAVYIMGLAFIASQMINLITMYYSYGAFTFDHLVSLIACGLVAITVLTLRHSKRFVLYAFIFSALIVLGTLSSAINQNTGINSALLPFFVLGTIMNGFISGWRATVIFGVFSLIFIWFLWWVSSNYSYTPIFDVEKFADRNFQRAVQASLAIILITMVGAFFSKNMHEAFAELEDGILAAKASDKAKTDFLATMSHELCTPMNGIVGMNDALEDTVLTADQKEMTSVIRHSGRELQMIIGNVLLFSQLEAGRIRLDSEPFNLSRVLRDAIKPFAVAAKGKGVIFKARMSPQVPAVILGDKDRAIQIISALLDNAVKFTDRGAVELVIDGTESPQGGSLLKVTITDTGIGVAPGQKERIFDRFTQEDETIKRRHGGTGLGLTIARGLTDLMGGRLTFQSELNVGSSFILELPYEAGSLSVEDSWKEAAE